MHTEPFRIASQVVVGWLIGRAANKINILLYVPPNHYPGIHWKGCCSLPHVINCWRYQPPNGKWRSAAGEACIALLAWRASQHNNIDLNQCHLSDMSGNYVDQTFFYSDIPLFRQAGSPRGGVMMFFYFFIVD